MTSPAAAPYRPNSPALLERQSAREIKRHAVIAQEDRTKAWPDSAMVQTSERFGTRKPPSRRTGCSPLLKGPSR